MFRSFRIARVAGIDILIHTSFALIVLLTAYQWSHFGTVGAVFGAVLSLALFTCVVLHELGHSLVAQAFGLPVKDITLYPIGGVARLASNPKKPLHELLIAIAGPMVNFVIAAVLALVPIFMLDISPEGLVTEVRLAMRQDVAPNLTTLWALLLTSNIFLGLFNLLPALPMDGGRVLRAFLSWFTDAQTATKAAAVIGRVFALGFIVLGVMSWQPFLAMIGVFVFMGAGAEVRGTQFQKVLEKIVAQDVVNTNVPKLTPANTIEEALQVFLAWPTSALAVEHFGRFIGVVARDTVLKALNEEGPHAYVAGIANRKVPVVMGLDTVEHARQVMAESESSYVAVLRDGIFLGLITDAEIAHQVVVLDAMQRRRGTLARAVKPGGTASKPNS